MLAGKVEKGDLVLLISFLMAREEYGVLYLEHPSLNGELHISDGEVIGAVSGESSGDEVLRKLLQLKTPTFRFERVSAPIKNLTDISKEILDSFICATADKQTVFNPFSILAPNPGKRPKTNLLDAKKWTLLNIIENGALFGRVQKSFSGPTATLIKNLNELLKDGVISIIPNQPSKNLFLFPKPVRIGLNQEETQIFWHIMDGISIYEMITKIDMNLESLTNIIIKIILKKKMVVSNGAGQILEPWHIYDSLGMALKPKPVKLAINHNGRVTSRAGVVVVDSILYGIWKQKLMGKDFNSITFSHGKNKHSIAVQTRNGIKNEIHFSPFDIKKLNLEVGKIVECEPELG